MSHVTSSLTPVMADAISCSQCGYQNAGWRTSCERCKTDLGQPGRPALPALPQIDRPGCLTVYALLLGLGAIVITLVGLGGLLAGEIAALVVIGYGLLQAAMSSGLWKMRKWARICTIFMLCLGLLVSFFVLVAAPIANVAVSAGALTGTLLNSFILYWLASNGNRFA